MAATWGMAEVDGFLGAVEGFLGAVEGFLGDPFGFWSPAQARLPAISTATRTPPRPLKVGDAVRTSPLATLPHRVSMECHPESKVTRSRSTATGLGSRTMIRQPGGAPVLRSLQARIQGPDDA